MFPLSPLKLHDCQSSGPGSAAELLIVEGDSASRSVVRVRDQRHQAVLPMQGKPLNAIKASRRAVADNAWFAALIAAVGGGWGDDFDLDRVRYRRLVLLFDPDADGIHCGALMMMFFHRWMRPLLETGRLSIVRPPLYEFASPDFADRLHAYSEPHYAALRATLDQKQIRFVTKRYRGLGSIDAEVLRSTCVATATRHGQPLQLADAEAAIRIFGGIASSVESPHERSTSKTSITSTSGK